MIESPLQRTPYVKDMNIFGEALVEPCQQTRPYNKPQYCASKFVIQNNVAVKNRHKTCQAKLLHKICVVLHNLRMGACMASVIYLYGVGGISQISQKSLTFRLRVRQQPKGDNPHARTPAFLRSHAVFLNG
jgi:hypothetical protein